MSDFPSEIVEAAAKAAHDADVTKYPAIAGQSGVWSWEEADDDTRRDYLAAARTSLAAVVPRIEQRVIDRLAREAGEGDLREDLCDAFAHHSMPLWERAEITDAVYAVADRAVRRARAENRIAQWALENYRESVVRDTKARCIREIVEALRERADGCVRIGSVEKAFHLRENADFIERTFLSPDNPHARNANEAIREVRSLPASEKGAMVNRLEDPRPGGPGGRAQAHRGDRPPGDARRRRAVRRASRGAVGDDRVHDRGEPTMTMFRCIWKIDVEADTPLEAAFLAEQSAGDPPEDGWVWEVVPSDQRTDADPVVVRTDPEGDPQADPYMGRLV